MRKSFFQNGLTFWRGKKIKEMSNLFYPLTRNIGDDLQVIALILQMHKSFNLLPRDNFESNVSLLEDKSFLNGWLSKTTFESFDYEFAAERILPISFHLANKRHVEGDWLNFFK